MITCLSGSTCLLFKVSELQGDYSWESAPTQRLCAPACPHCLAGDRSDTEANTCSSEDRDLAKYWPLYSPLVRTLDSKLSHSCSCWICQPSLTNDTGSDLMFSPTVFLPHKRHRQIMCNNNTKGVLNRPGRLQLRRCFSITTHVWSAWLSKTQ